MQATPGTHTIAPSWRTDLNGWQLLLQNPGSEIRFSGVGAGPGGVCSDLMTRNKTSRRYKESRAAYTPYHRLPEAYSRRYAAASSYAECTFSLSIPGTPHATM